MLFFVFFPSFTSIVSTIIHWKITKMMTMLMIVMVGEGASERRGTWCIRGKKWRKIKCQLFNVCFSRNCVYFVYFFMLLQVTNLSQIYVLAVPWHYSIQLVSNFCKYAHIVSNSKLIVFKICLGIFLNQLYSGFSALNKNCWTESLRTEHYDPGCLLVLIKFNKVDLDFT